MKLTVLLPFIFLNYWAYCQNQTDRSYIIQNSNIHKLQKIATDFLTLQSQFDTTNIPKQLIIDGKTAYFSHFDANGQVVYATLENESSAISSKIDVIRSGGSSGLNLDGNNIVFGLWDAGPPRETHQEYAGKITVVDSVAISNHATHIAGTLIASGIVSLCQKKDTHYRVLLDLPRALHRRNTAGNACFEVRTDDGQIDCCRCILFFC